MEYAACAWRAGRGVCRCCLSEGCYKDIATEYYWMGERELYQDMLRECFDLTISYQDGGTNSNSRLICEVCITRLRDASNFKKQVINAEKRFAEHILTGSKLSDITEAAPAATFQEVKLEGVKDETGISDDDDMGADEAATDDPDYDPDYDESDMLPLKFEVQKKEALVEFSFGDEMPTLNTNETTIRRVSKSKGKSPSKKIKMSKKELTIKPIKASGSKVAKVPKAPKPAKVPVKKGRKRKKKTLSPDLIQWDTIVSEPGYELGVLDICEQIKSEMTDTTSVTSQPKGAKQPKSAIHNKKEPKINACTIIVFSLVCPFRNKNNSYICFYCTSMFYDPAVLRKHSQTHTPDPKVVYRNLPKNRRPVKMDITEIDCRLCDEKISDVTTLKNHLSTSHGKKIYSEFSDGILPFKLDKDVLNCVICNKEYHAFTTLNNHMNTHYDNFICDICGTGFVTYSRLRTHRKIHSEEKITCEQCGKEFPNALKHQKHIRFFHLKKTETKCPECPAIFHDAKKRRRHQEEVHGKRAIIYKCDVCGNVFTNNSNLSQHVRRDHKHERKYECKHCSRKFFSKQFFGEHVLAHIGHMFKCEVCESTFKWKGSLIRHMRMHKQGRYPCAACGKVFNRDFNLKKHLKTHIYLGDEHAVEK